MNRKVMGRVMSELLEGELHIFKWQYRLHGDFFKHLMEAIIRADYINIAKLRLAFPDIIDAYRDFTQGDLASKFDQLEEKYLLEDGIIDESQIVHEVNKEKQ
jgi:hypothetical protein